MAGNADLMRSIGGQTVKVEDRGQGPVLLFLHGAGGSNWSPMLEHLSREFRVIAPEHPGFGRTQIPEWMMSIGDLAYFYLDLLDNLDLKNVHLVGHSLGGWLSAEIAVRNSARLKSITLMAPAGIANPDAPFGDIFAWGPEEAARNQFYSQELAEKRLKATPDLDIVLQNKAATARLGWSPRLSNPQLKYWIHRINKPTQLVWGRDDKIIPHACNNAWISGIANAKLHTLNECGHSIHSEKPSEAAALIAAFCKGAAA